MSESPSKQSFTAGGERTPSAPTIDVAAATDLDSREVRAGLEGIAETLAELQTTALLSALNAPTQKNKTKGPARTLTKEDALKEVKALRDIRSRLTKSESEATTEVSGIRARVRADDLQNFDNALYDWVNRKG